MITKEELGKLVEAYTPLSARDKARLYDAYDYAKEAHKGQKRESGEAYFIHPLCVAETAATEYELDIDAIIAALLHDVLEDTGASLKEINSRFGRDVSDLVSGLTRLREIRLPPASEKAENYRRFVISVSKDIRVLIIKLIDRAHNISTLQHKDEAKRKRIARETMEIYIPLAERIGMEQAKVSMENVCFKELYPQEHAFIQEKLRTIQKQANLIEPIVDELTSLTSKNRIRATIYGREKTNYSIWRKMNGKNISFDEIFDIIAFRFIVESVADCYRVLGMIHSNYKMVPRRFKDYISTPKPNKYQSLHTTIVGPLGKQIEVQIRTQEMDRVAQYGYAAHWLYKSGKRNTASNDFMWLKNMAEAVRSISNPEEIEESAKMTPYSDSIFCFTPKGELVALPAGATALDFAYEIHSHIGNHCVGAKINKVIRNIKAELKTGDFVEILTNKSQSPSAEWERFVVSKKAREAIRHYLKLKRRDEVIAYGKTLIAATFSQYKQELGEKALADAADKMKLSSEEVCYLVGEKEYTPEHILFLVHPELKSNKREEIDVEKIIERAKKSGSKSIVVGGSVLSNIPLYFSKCCYPVPGDTIVGVIHTGKGVAIHKRSCRDMRRYATLGNQMFNLTWDDIKAMPASTFRAKIAVMCDRTSGNLNSITTIIAKHNAIIDDIHVISRSSDFIEFLISIDVKNLQHLDEIIGSLKMAKMINAVIKYS